MTPLPVRRLCRAVQAEWTKLWTVPSTPWLLAAAVALTVAGSAGALAADGTVHLLGPDGAPPVGAAVA